MPKFPEPPPVSQLRELPLADKVLPAGSLLWRIYRRGGQHPTLWQTFRHFGPLNGRFDHQLPGAGRGPQLQERGILYTAGNLITCLAKVFQDTRLIHRGSADQPWIVGFELAAPVRLLDLTGTWPTRVGASMVVGPRPRPRARRWSRAIYEAYPDCQGIYSASSMHANQPMISFYERAEDALPEYPVVHRPLNDPALLEGLDRAARTLGYDLV